ncbi:hypothetical protein [Streptomyces zaomyceticus]|uniref:hypothetical protein n=1 Tax=Streptomyces zaomyceticus TaxID=68286 RepID=UPI002E0E6791|nr:hypothetical protein OG237_43275 [Streptomyces zaomyceticus]
MTAAPGRDSLIAVVKRAIEQHLPGGTYGVDVASMAREVVRQVRRQQAFERVEKLVETLGGIAPARAEEASRTDAS